MRRMKDSGIAWIGEIPEEWETLPLARVIKERVSGNWGSEPTPATDNIICIRVADFDFSKFSILDKSEYTQRGYKNDESLSMLTYGDILFEKSGGGQTTPVGRAIFFNKKMEATHSNFIDKLRVHDKYSNKFIFYYILIGYLTTYSNMYIKQTTGIQNFDLTNFLAKERICLPELPEQQRIADYLDAKCTEIDRSMELVRQGIDKLREYKKSVITEAVTKGLDPDVPMKDSGVPWIGETPETWQIKKLKNITEIERGKFTHRPRNDPRFYGGIYPFIQTGDIASAEKYITHYKQTLNDKGLSVSQLFKKGTIVMSIAANIGDIAIINFDSCFPDSIIAFKNIELINNDFLFYLLKSLKSIFIENSIISTQLNINIEIVGNIKVAVPPIHEQIKIASYLDAKCAEIDTLISQKQALLDKLAEYKKSLIFECVTGKREVAA